MGEDINSIFLCFDSKQREIELISKKLWKKKGKDVPTKKLIAALCETI